MEKINRISSIIESFLLRTRVTKRDLLVILGHMNFAMQVIKPGRSFVSYLLKLAHSTPNLRDHVVITNECRLDFQMWKHFLSSWNGISMFIQETIDSPDYLLYTDASGAIGYGGFFQNKWFADPWPVEVLNITSDMSIAWMELYPIVTAAVLWGQEWANKCINFHCDNMTTVHIINKGRSKSQFIMKLVRKLTLVASIHNFNYAAKHVPGKLNEISDALSRLQIHRFRMLAPQAEARPTTCPNMRDLMYPDN